MRTRPGPAATILAILIASSLPCAHAQTSRGQITIQQAREVLGANPAAIPGYPVEIFRLDGRAILVRQRLDSVRVIAFREDRQGRPQFFRTTGKQDEKQRFLAGGPSEGERRTQAWQGYRQVGVVSVHYLRALPQPIPSDLLDKLEPIP